MQMAQAAGRIGERRGHRVQAIEPDRAAGRLRKLLAGGVVALAVGAVEVVARALAVLVVLVRAGLEGLALRTGAAVVGLAVRARRTRALRARVLGAGALVLAGRGVVATLLAVVGLAGGAMVAGGSALAAAAAIGTSVSAGGRQGPADGQSLEGARRRRSGWSEEVSLRRV